MNLRTFFLVVCPVVIAYVINGVNPKKPTFSPTPAPTSAPTSSGNAIEYSSCIAILAYSVMNFYN